MPMAMLAQVLVEFEPKTAGTEGSSTSTPLAVAMTSIGTAVSRMTGPLPYAVAAARAASVSPIDAAGAEDAIPMTTSCVTLMASG